MSDFDFACSCDITTYPYYERLVKSARKEHRCYDCNRKILPGSWYISLGGMCEGEWWNGKICPRCWSMFQWVKAHIPCVCVSYGNMREELTEICREASRQVPGLLFGFYRRVLGNKVMECPTNEYSRSKTS